MCSPRPEGESNHSVQKFGDKRMSTAMRTFAPTPARRAVEQLNFLRHETTLKIKVFWSARLWSLGDSKDPSAFIFSVTQSFNLYYLTLTPSKRRKIFTQRRKVT